ncbi:MAG: choice-of-anchor Q domain-containing protein, partial [Acidobacteriaceae bacterium]
MRTNRTFLHRPACFSGFFSSLASPSARRFPRLLAVGLGALLLCATSAHATTQTLTVNTLADSNDGACDSTTCSLRDAIVLANLDTGDTIQFSVAGTITLTSALPGIAQSMTIQGPATGGVTVSGGNSTAVGTIFAITSSSATVSITGLTIANGNSPDGVSGGIHDAFATLIVTNSTFYHNTSSASSGGGSGGGISSNGGAVTVINSTFVGNTLAGANSFGGAIVAVNGTLTVVNSTFYGNSASSGGAIDNVGATLSVSNSLLTGDTGGECVGTGCPTNGTGGNVVGVTAAQASLLPLGNYGGTTRTMLPQPGSTAICAGSASDVPSGVTADQRGFALNAANCSNGGVDAGAVQTAYVKVTGSLASSYTGPEDVDLTGLSGTVSTSGITLNGAVNLIGPGANKLTLSGGNANQVLSVSSGANAAIYGVTVANGANTPLAGGGIDNQGTLAILNSAISGNTAGSGGGIYSVGTLTVINSTFSGNSAPSGNGGGIDSQGTLTVINSTFSNNTVVGGAGDGGAIQSGGTLTVVNSTFSGNSADTAGAIEVFSGSATIDNSIFADNAATGSGAGLHNSGTLNAGNNIYHSNLDGGSTEDDCKNCTSNANAVTASGEPLVALGSYGGRTQTLLPLPITTGAICSGSSSLALDENGSALTTDQRGVAVGVGGYCASGAVDAGAVQTNYQSVQFTNDTGYTALVNQVVSPSPILSVTENGQNVGGIPLTLSFAGSGTASGLGPVTTVAGTGATFS